MKTCSEDIVDVVECSERHPCEGLSRHAHFRNFGIAFLTLFRVATGDNWNGIMKVWNVAVCLQTVDCISVSNGTKVTFVVIVKRY